MTWGSWAAVGLLARQSRVCTARVACESKPASLDGVRLSGKKKVCVCVGVIRGARMRAIKGLARFGKKMYKLGCLTPNLYLTHCPRILTTLTDGPYNPHSARP